MSEKPISPLRQRMIEDMSGSMFVVAWVEVGHGKPASEAHLITSAPLAKVVASTASVDTVRGIICFNAIHEALYVGPAESRPLHLDGVVNPRKD